MTFFELGGYFQANFLGLPQMHTIRLIRLMQWNDDGYAVSEALQ